MTVRDLIEKLLQLDENLKVIGIGCDEVSFVKEVAVDIWYDSNNVPVQRCEIRLESC